MSSVPASERWLFNKDELGNTPSRQAGVDPLKETQYRFDGCTFISVAGQKLKVPQTTIATAQVYFHRFYMYRAFTKYDKKELASCCLFLAGKVEDTPKRLNDILRVSYYLERKNEQNIRKEDLLLDEKSEEYWNRKNKLLANERTLLQTLGFDLEVEHPYDRLIGKCRILETSNKVAQLAWNLINDSLRGTTICLEVGPDLVSTAAIKLAVQHQNYEDKIKAPSNGKKWWQAITTRPKDVESAEMESTIEIIKSVFPDEAKAKATLSLDDYKKRGAKSEPQAAGNKKPLSESPSAPVGTDVPRPALAGATDNARKPAEGENRKRPISQVDT